MFNILKKDFKIIINIKKQLFTMLAFILVLVLFSAMFRGYMQEKRLIDKVHVGIVDSDGSTLSGALIGHFENNKEFMSLFTVVKGEEEVLTEKFDNNELSAIILIPDQFITSLLNFDNTPLRIILNTNYPLQNTVLENIMTSYSTYIKAVDVGIYSLYKTLKDEDVDRDELSSINDRFSVTMVATALGRNILFEHKVIETFPASTSGPYFLYAIIILIIIFTASSGSSLLSSEISNNCLSRYKTTGNMLYKVSMSKVIIMYLNTMILLIPMLFIIRFVNPNITVSSMMIMFLFLSLIIIFFASLSLTIGILLQKKDINLLFSTMVTLILGILGGNFIPIQIMPKFIQDISSFTPNYWMLRSCLYINNNTITKEFHSTYLILIIITIGILFSQNILLSKGDLWEK